MSDIQDRVKVAAESALLVGEESGLVLKNFFSGMARWQKYVFYISLLLIVPAYFGAYYAAKAITTARLEPNLLEAHVSYKEIKEVSVTPVKLLKVADNQYAAYFQITNSNLDLVAPEVSYEIELYNTQKEKVQSVTGKLFLLADQSKTIISSRIISTEELTLAKLIMDEVDWQKRLDVPTVSFRTPKPEVYDQTTIIPPQLVVEGSVVNDSEYTVGKIAINFMLYDQTGQLVGVATREERNVAAFGRRAYKQLWTNLNSEQVAKVEVSVDVNTLEKSNIKFSSNEGVPVSSLPELN